jgi:hypothetical protein
LYLALSRLRPALPPGSQPVNSLVREPGPRACTSSC